MKLKYWWWIVFVIRCLLVGFSPQWQPFGLVAVGGATYEQRLQLIKWCHSVCVGEWTPYSSCSERCGGGVQVRRRQFSIKRQCEDIAAFACRKSKYQERPCNEACPNGIALGNGRCWCRDGWQGRCCDQEITCISPNLPPNVYMDVQTLPVRYGTVATFHCPPGYQLSGDPFWTCGDDGWDGAAVQCNAIMCPMPTTNDPHLTILEPKTGYELNQLLYYKCDDGYEIQGSESRQCRESPLNTTGWWTGFTPTCEEIVCLDPGIPANGRRNGTTTKFGDIVTFSCNDGYKLVGSLRIECVASKRWFGHIPTCEAITCDPPFVPEHGRMRVQRSETGPQAIFSCKDGYTLNGAMVLQCTESGYWNNTEPVCEAVDCGDPGQLEDGYKDGILYRYPHSVTFSCHRGYMLEGRKSITCQHNEEWSGTIPQCRACPVSTYDGGRGRCESCPADSHTMTEASTSLHQCVCDEGFTGVPGGKCIKVRCMELTTPEFGNITDCDTLVGGFCNFVCNDGYMLEQGSAMRSCMLNGVWSGREPLCAPCAINTYKNSEKTCLPCPEHSSTDSPGQMREGCVCDLGFYGPPGGPCLDINECLENDGSGPCEDECENNIGSYRCRCNRPGYAVDEDNPHACYPELQCKNITEDEAPRHGGLVCHWYNEQSSIFCGVRCNAGYEHPVQTNDYETCGPLTNFQWSFTIDKKRPDKKFLPCVEEFIPGIRLEADALYFTSNCHDLSAADTLVVKEAFANMLNAKSVCMKSSTQLCEIKDMGLICGRTTRRRRRDTGEVELVSDVDVMLNISALARIQRLVDCNQTTCDFLHIPEEYCEELCVRTYSRFIKAAMIYAERQLIRVYSDTERLQELIINAANRIFTPKSSNNIHTSGLLEECEPGLALINSSCRACDAGSYLDEVNNTCALCGPNTYQDEPLQYDCKPCPIGTFTNMIGSTICSICGDGFWGENCEEQCDCVHGVCSPFDGSCACDSGYEGTNCDTDIPGCRDNECFPGVHCTDIPAPGTGFICDACPDGYHGDGATCISDSLNVTSLRFDLPAM